MKSEIYHSLRIFRLPQKRILEMLRCMNVSYVRVSSHERASSLLFRRILMWIYEWDDLRLTVSFKGVSVRRLPRRLILWRSKGIREKAEVFFRRLFNDVLNIVNTYRSMIRERWIGEGFEESGHVLVDTRTLPEFKSRGTNLFDKRGQINSTKVRTTLRLSRCFIGITTHQTYLFCSIIVAVLYLLWAVNEHFCSLQWYQGQSK